MRKSNRGKVLLAGACLLAGVSAWGQQTTGTMKIAPRSIDVGVTYSAERAYIAPGSCDCFWFNGGGADVAITLWKGFGAAAALTGDHASDVNPGIDISKVTYMGGPRYTHILPNWKTGPLAKRRWEVFGEGLFGEAHAFNSAFPNGAQLKPSAHSFAMQTGGGISIFFSKRIAARVLEADYVRTNLPNSISDVQNDVRLGAGVTYHVGSLPHLR